MSRMVSKAVMKKKLLILTLIALIVFVPVIQGCTCGCTANDWVPCVISDNSGGAIVTYGIYEKGDRNAYIQRIDVDGNKLWGEEGVLLSSASPPDWLRFPQMVADDSGGAIIVWKQSDGVFAQKVNSEGHMLWQEEGVLVFSGFKEYQGIVSDGSGGAIIATSSHSEEIKGYILHILRIDSEGNLLWTKDDAPLCLEADTGGGRFGIAMASDNLGGAVIVWERRSGGIFVQRIGSEGNVLWVEGGVKLSSTPNVYRPAVIGDGSGGAIVVWEQVEVNEEGQQISSIYAQRVDAEGNILWRQGGLPICSSSELPISDPRIVSDGSGGTIIIWMTHNDLYAQRIDSDGNIQWAKDGVRVQGSEGPQSTSYEAIAAGSEGAIISFVKRSGDARDPEGLGYVQKLDATGGNQWQPNGILVSTESCGPKIADDGFGGAVIVCWLYVQRISAQGEWMWGEKGVLLSRGDIF